MTGYNRSIFTSGTTTYTDIDMSFLASPTTGDIRKKSDEAAIKQSLTNLLYTNFGERPFRPGIGGNLGDQLFEPLDQITRSQLDYAIRTTINNWEPRIQIEALVINDKPDQNALEVTLKYSMLNIIAPATISILLKRTR